MKSTFFFVKMTAVAAVFLIVPPAFAKSGSKDSADDSETAGSTIKQDWKQFGKDSAEAAKSLGKALGKTGKKIGEDVKNSFDEKYCGTWIYKDKKVTTTIVIGKDGTMSVTQKQALDVQYWQGTYSGTLALIVFKINKSGSKTGFSKKEVDDNKTWRILYSVDDDKGTMSLTCSAIPTDADGHNFSDSTVFVKS
ncbi:MAG TPA: hypothetical protein DCL73_05135 [Treponema sp.]|nr:hypothetical protein [Treponema sp.]